MRANAQLGSQLKHSLQKIDASWVYLGEYLPDILGGIHLKAGLVLWELGYAGPGSLGWRTHDAKYPDYLVFVRRFR